MTLNLTRLTVLSILLAGCSNSAPPSNRSGADTHGAKPPTTERPQTTSDRDLRTTGVVKSTGISSLEIERPGKEPFTWAVAEDAVYLMKNVEVTFEAIQPGDTVALTIGRRGDRASGVMSVATRVEITPSGDRTTGDTQPSDENQWQTKGIVQEMTDTWIKLQNSEDKGVEPVTWAIVDDAEYTKSGTIVTQDALQVGDSVTLTVDRRGDRSSGLMSVVVEIQIHDALQ